MLYRYLTERQISWTLYRRRIVAVLLVSVAGYFLGLSLWPFALENPFLNPWKSYQVMAHFPTTIRQIFEGKAIWSDLLPWYYLPKSMLITIPVLVWLGLGLFLIPFIRSLRNESAVLYSFLLFTVLFPPVFAVLKQVNLYGSWRHFLFIYPGMVLLAALGLTGFFRLKKHYLLNLAVGAVLLLLCPASASGSWCGITLITICIIINWWEGSGRHTAITRPTIIIIPCAKDQNG